MADDRFRWARPPRKAVRRVEPDKADEIRAAEISQLRDVMELLGERLAEHGLPVEPLAPEPDSSPKFRWRKGMGRAQKYAVRPELNARVAALLAQVRERLALMDQHRIELGPAELDAVNLVLPQWEAR